MGERVVGIFSSYTASGESAASIDLVSIINNSLELRLRGIHLGIIVSIRPFKWFANDEDLRVVFNRLFDASGARRIWNNPVSSGFQPNKDGLDDVDRHRGGHDDDSEGEEGSGEEEESENEHEREEVDDEEKEEVENDDEEDKEEDDKKIDAEGSEEDALGKEVDTETNQVP